jgi:AraC-like DNA-binding protein
VTSGPLPRHLLRARDLADSRYAEPLDLDALARAANVSPRHVRDPSGNLFRIVQPMEYDIEAMKPVSTAS